MLVYNDINLWYQKELVKEVTRILNEIAIEIQQYLRTKILEEIYQSYEPHIYTRTEQLLNSAQIKPMVKSGDEYYIEIYIPEDVIHSNASIFSHPDIGISEGENPTLAQIAEMFAKGYGYSRGGEKLDPVGDTAEYYLEQGKALQFIMNELRRKFDVIQ